MFMFLHLFCPYEINAAARHNTMYPVSSAVFLLLFTADCIFRDVFLPLHLPAAHLCFGSLYMEDVLIALFTHKVFTSVPLHASWLFFLCIFFSRVISLRSLSPLAVLGSHTYCSSPGSTSTLDATTVRLEYYKRCNYFDRPFFLVHVWDARC